MAGLEQELQQMELQYGREFGDTEEELEEVETGTDVTRQHLKPNVCSLLCNGLITSKLKINTKHHREPLIFNSKSRSETLIWF